jgi:hypothetical protein
MIGVDVKDIGECFFSVIERGVSIIQETDSVPYVWILSLSSATTKETVHWTWILIPVDTLDMLSEVLPSSNSSVLKLDEIDKNIPSNAKISPCWSFD